jgi:hypothetical protein
MPILLIPTNAFLAGGVILGLILGCRNNEDPRDGQKSPQRYD